MNQDQVKEKLQQLRPDAADFTLIFSGKASKKVNGLYHPETAEIIIHNKNFEDDNALMYTAIREFAHHVCPHKGPRAHTTAFRSAFHGLLAEAEEKGIYTDVVSKTPELQEMAARIRDLQRQQAELLKQMGQELMEAEKLCRKHNARFEDFIERGVKMAKPAAATAMKIKALDIPAELGPDNMKTLAAIRNNQARSEATEALMEGDTPDQVKEQLKHLTKAPEDPESPVQLMREKKRIQATMDKLADRLEQIDMILEEDGGES